MSRHRWAKETSEPVVQPAVEILFSKKISPPEIFDHKNLFFVKVVRVDAKTQFNVAIREAIEEASLDMSFIGDRAEMVEKRNYEYGGTVWIDIQYKDPKLIEIRFFLGPDTNDKNLIFIL